VGSRCSLTQWLEVVASSLSDRRQRKDASLGVYPDVPLKKARQRRDDTRQVIAENRDPSKQRHAEQVGTRQHV